MKVNQLNDSMLYYYSFYNIVLKFDIPKCCNSDFFACRLFQGLKITDIISALTFHYFGLYCCYRRCRSKSLWFLDLESLRNLAELRWWFENWLSSSACMLWFRFSTSVVSVSVMQVSVMCSPFSMNDIIPLIQFSQILVQIKQAINWKIFYEFEVA